MGVEHGTQAQMRRQDFAVAEAHPSSEPAQHSLRQRRRGGVARALLTSAAGDDTLYNLRGRRTATLRPPPGRAGRIPAGADRAAVVKGYRERGPPACGPTAARYGSC